MNHECGTEKKIECQVCSKKFRRKWNLEQHVKRVHRDYYESQSQFHEMRSEYQQGSTSDTAQPAQPQTQLTGANEYLGGLLLSALYNKGGPKPV
jgi:hypothetical protein